MTSQNAKKLFVNVTVWLTWCWDNSVKLLAKVALASLVLAVGVPAVGLAAALVLVVGVPVVIYLALRMIVQTFVPERAIMNERMRTIDLAKVMGYYMHLQHREGISKKSSGLASS